MEKEYYLIKKWWEGKPDTIIGYYYSTEEDIKKEIKKLAKKYLNGKIDGYYGFGYKKISDLAEEL